MTRSRGSAPRAARLAAAVLPAAAPLTLVTAVPVTAMPAQGGGTRATLHGAC